MKECKITIKGFVCDYSLSEDKIQIWFPLNYLKNNSVNIDNFNTPPESYPVLACWVECSIYEGKGKFIYSSAFK